MDRISSSNRDLLISEAYKLIDTGTTSVADFEKELNHIKPKFDILNLVKLPKNPDGIIIMGQFNGNQDLKPIIYECMGLLDQDKPDVAQCVRTRSAYKLEVVTSKYHIKIYRDLNTKADALLIKHRF